MNLKPEYEKIIDTLQFYEDINDFYEYQDDYLIVSDLRVVRTTKDAKIKWIQYFREDIILKSEIRGDTIKIIERSNFSYIIDIKNGDIIKWE